MQYVLKSMPPQVRAATARERARGECEHLWVLSEARAAQFCLLLVCPQLCGWVSSSDGEPVPLALSPESIYNSGQKIFVLDSFINVQYCS